MTDGADAAFRRFVAAERDGLLAEALRLTGDPDRAEDAVQRALARTRRDWGRRGADPAATAADALHAAATGRGDGQVLESLAAGLSTGRIAQRLALSDKTVRNHVSAVLTKLQVPDRSAAVARAREAGLGR